MTQIFMSTSLSAIATVVAAIDAGLVEDNGPRLLLAVNGAPVPEVTTSLLDQPGAKPLLDRFDRVIDLNEFTAPHAPNHWNPRDVDLPVFARVLRDDWDLGTEDIELFVQSPQVAPAKTLMRMFESGTVHVISDGLMSYSPLRSEIPYSIQSRIASLIYLDLLDGVRPVLFSELDIELRAVPADAARAAFALAADAETDPLFAEICADQRPTALVLGQYLSSIRLIPASEEIALQERMIERAIGMGAERVLFKPHPAAPPAAVSRLVEGHLDVDIVVVDTPWVAESLMPRINCVGVIAAFSTGLATARSIFDLAIDAVGPEELLPRLDPYENSNRIPLVAVDALTRADDTFRAPEALQRLVRAVGYVQQPKIVAHLRDEAIDVIGSLSVADRERYFPASRLAKLGLPGGSLKGEGMRAVITHQLDKSDQGQVFHRAVSVLRGRTRRAVKVLRGH
ncbi:polysialyltransferase family glycosyltransferase [Demequina soli]|uniref:polysialyltransferase family glycosyltransferase n=1 Tax=Demequina soli TaxID=1638987 RepID=UPI000783C64D|nr:polysialyltransferase family glycosyltransferase [Demequina soli]